MIQTSPMSAAWCCRPCCPLRCRELLFVARQRFRVSSKPTVAGRGVRRECFQSRKGRAGFCSGRNKPATCAGLIHSWSAFKKSVKRFGGYTNAPLISFGREFFQQAAPTKQVNKSRRLVAQKFCGFNSAINSWLAVAILRGCGLGIFAASQFKEFAPLGGCHGRIRPERGVQNCECVLLHSLLLFSSGALRVFDSLMYPYGRRGIWQVRGTAPQRRLYEPQPGDKKPQSGTIEPKKFWTGICADYFLCLPAEIGLVPALFGRSFFGRFDWRGFLCKT